jgi:hypothetical protein
MAKAKFDIKTLELPPVAAKPLYAGVGVTDLAVELVRDYVSDVQAKLVGYQKDVQKTVTEFDFEPKALRKQAVTVVNARRAAIEARVAELQADAQALPTRVQGAVNENVATLADTYGDLVKRGEVLVTRIRKQEATKATKASAKTTTAKAKTTKTQATKATKSTAKKATSTAKKSSGPARSSAKATATAAKKTASNAAQATTAAAEKVGD